MPVNALLSHLERLQPEALQWLERMVRINSFTANRDGVIEVGKVTAECFESLGFVSEFVRSTVPEQGDHLFLRRAREGAPRVLLVTHLDTVFPPEEEERNDFHWQLSPAEGRIYGPGSIDIKGGTVLIWMMLHALREHAPEVFEKTDWTIAANAAEEVLSKDFAEQTTRRCPPGVAAVLVYEGGPFIEGEYQLVTARKGRAEYRLEAHGRGAHAGSAFADGVNAILSIADVAKAVAALSDETRSLTVNVATIAGGTVLNRVPHEASIELEMRAYEPEVLSQAGEAVMQMRRPMNGREAAIETSCLGKSPGWPADERTLGLAHHFVQAAEQLGLRVKLTKRGGLSDANYLCHLGPTLDGLGPSGGNAHCSERSADGTKVPEYLEPASLVPKAAINVLALMRLLAP